jgi:hypothetical protein
VNLNKYLIYPILLGGCLISACANDSHSGSDHILLSAAAIVNSNATPADKAEQLARQSEVLLTAQGFLQASTLVDLALQNDPNNLRAKFIKVMMGPVLAVKGMNIRVRPLAEKDPKVLKEYENDIEKTKAEMPDSSFKDFLFDGQPDIHDEAELQAQFDNIAQAFENIRVFVKSIKATTELTVKANTLLVPDLNQRYAMACEIKETKNLEYELICPPSENRYNVTLNQADFANLRDLAAAYEMSFALYNSYDLSGAIEVAKSKKSRKVPAQEFVNDLLKKSNFGHLRPTSKIQNMKEWGLDYVAGWQWIVDHQDTLCPRGQNSGKNRPGMWLNEGICYGSYLQPYIDSLQTILTKENQDLESTKGGKTYATKFNPMRLFDNPVADLRALGPFTIDKCNQLVKIGEPTMAGVFPAGDANSVLPLRMEKCRK